MDRDILLSIISCFLRNVKKDLRLLCEFPPQCGEKAGRTILFLKKRLTNPKKYANNNDWHTTMCEYAFFPIPKLPTRLHGKTRHKKPTRRCKEIWSVLTSPRRDTEWWSTVSARECPLPTAERFSREDAQRADISSLIDLLLIYRARRFDETYGKTEV